MKFSWQEAEEKIAKRLQSAFGWDRDRSKLVAEIASDSLRTAYGGSQFYLSRSNGRFKTRIKEEFNGRNIVELSQKYGVCAQTVRNYLK